VGAHCSWFPFLYRLGPPHVSYWDGSCDFNFLPNYDSFDFGAFGYLAHFNDYFALGWFNPLYDAHDLGCGIPPDVWYWWALLAFH
jgi:hypothetical protein